MIVSLCFTMSPLPIVSGTSADEFDLLREKWKGMLTGGHCDLDDPNIAVNVTNITNTAQSRWNSMYKNADRTSLWPYITFGNDPGRITTTYNYLEDMALAYATENSSLYQNQAMLQDIISGLEWMDERIYNPTKSAYQNWWHWQIGAPLALNNCTILIYEELTENQRSRYMQAVAHFQNDIAMGGANRQWECEIFTARGIISKNPAVLEEVRAGFSNLLGMVTSRDGFYEDGSFVQHNFFPYNGGYGQSLIAGISNLLYILDGSSWELNEIAKYNVYRWVYDAYEMFIYKGAFMDMVRGREMAREYSGTDYIGHKVMSAILRLSQTAPEKDAKAFQSMVKYWILSNTEKSYFDDASIEMITFAKAILNDPSIEPREELIGYKQFYNMDRAVQLRPDYGIGISMFSSRMGNYESINSENQKSYHTADGMVYLYNNDLLQYSDDFWPTVNLYRLAGTTVIKDSTVAGNKPGDKDWVGGTELSGLYGVSGMELHPPGQSLVAKKSWFLFDDEMVALGAGINSTNGIMVETIAENRKIKGNNAFTVNGSEKPTALGWNETMNNTNWAHIEGNVNGADIGYYFPEGANVKAMRESRTGSWNNMATEGSTTPITSNYLTMWFEHGTNPVDETYAYVTLPNKTAQETGSYAQNPNITVLENSPSVQAVKETNLNMIGANFWTDTKKTAGGITSNKKASVMMKQTGTEIEISVSDPTQNNTDWIDIEIDRSAAGIIFADSNIVVKQLYPTIRFAVSVNGSKGRPHQAKFSLVEPMQQQEQMKDTYIVDNTDSGFTTDSPWALNHVSLGYYGINAAHDNTSGADSNRWAKWTPDIIEADTYDVYIRWVAESNRPSAAPLEIKFDGGVDTSLVVNQKYNNGVWIYIGSYPLSAGTDQYVKLHASAPGYTSADAVKFVAWNAKGNVARQPVSLKAPEPKRTIDFVNEKFESGNFTVENIYNGSNLYKKLFKKDGNTLWTAELNSNAVSFETANPQYSNTFLAIDQGTPSKKVNPTQYFSTEPGRLTRSSGGEDIRVYHNFPNKITKTDDQSLVYVDVRLKKSLTESITMVISENPMTSYSQTGGKAAVAFSVAKYTPSLTYDPSGTKVVSTKNFDFAEWIYVRTIIDLENQKATMLCGETLENLQPWAGLGSESTYNLLSNVDGISSIYFKGKGSLAMDDLHIYSVNNIKEPYLANPIVEEGALKSIDLCDTEALPSVVTVIAAIYNEEDVLQGLKVLQDVVIDGNLTEQTILLDQMPYQGGQKIKLYVWDSAISMNPLTPYLVYPME